MGTSQDYRVAAEEGATRCDWFRVVARLTFRHMGFADVWNKTLVYFGIAEEEEWDEDGYLTDEDLAAHLRRAPERPPAGAAPAPRRVRRLDRPRAGDGAHGVLRPAPEPGALRGVESVPCANVKVHLVLPRSFNDAQQIADRFKEGVPGDPEPPELRPGALEAPDRLRAAGSRTRWTAACSASPTRSSC